MEKPLVSVCITVYNGERYLREAMESVLSQTFTDFEFVIVDDGSTDKTIEIINSYDDPRIVFIPQEKNRHVCYTSNIAIENARGKYIARIDTDDIWNVTKLEKQVDFMEKNPSVGACFTEIDLIDEAGSIVNEAYPDVYQMFQTNNVSRKEWIEYFLKKDNCLCNSSSFVRKEVLDKIGYNNILLIQSHDFDMWTRVISISDIYIISEKLTLYRWQSEDVDYIQISKSSDNVVSRFRTESSLIKSKLLFNISDADFIELFSEDFIYANSKTSRDLLFEKYFLLQRMISDTNDVILKYLAFNVINEALSGDDNSLIELEDIYGETIHDLYKRNLSEIFYTNGLHEHISALEESNLEMNKVIENQNAMITHLQTELNHIVNSKGWKLLERLRKPFK